MKTFRKGQCESSSDPLADVSTTLSPHCNKNTTPPGLQTRMKTVPPLGDVSFSDQTVGKQRFLICNGRWHRQQSSNIFSFLVVVVGEGVTDELSVARPDDSANPESFSTLGPFTLSLLPVLQQAVFTLATAALPQWATIKAAEQRTPVDCCYSGYTVQY